MAFAASALLSVSTVATEATLDAGRCDTVRAAMASLKLAEIPHQAARWVRESESGQRGAVAKAAIEAALAKYPTAVYATVKAVVAVAPENVVSIMEAVVNVAPKHVKTAMRAIAENENASLTAAMAVVSEKAPAQLGAAQSVAGRRGGNAQLADGGTFSGTPAIIQQTTTATTPPASKTSNNYPNP